MGSSSNNPDIASIHADVIIDLAVSQPERLTQDEWSSKLAQSSWLDIPDELPPDPKSTFSGSWGETVLAGPIPLMGPWLSLLTMLGQWEATIVTWAKWTQFILQLTRPHILLAPPPFLMKT